MPRDIPYDSIKNAPVSLEGTDVTPQDLKAFCDFHHVEFYAMGTPPGVGGTGWNDTTVFRVATRPALGDGNPRGLTIALERVKEWVAARSTVIDPNDVRVVWCSNWYDGPLEGHAWYQGKYCVFQAVEDYDPKAPSYDLYELQGDALLRALASRKLFEDMVGYGYTYGPNGEPVSAGHDNGVDPAGYYASWKNKVPDVDVTTLPRLGRYTYGPAAEPEAPLAL